jgi:hypothetical protein
MRVTYWFFNPFLCSSKPFGSLRRVACLSSYPGA